MKRECRHDEDDRDARDEEPKRRYYTCPDRMCGADDCPRCRPNNFLEGVYIGDIEEAENKENEENQKEE